MAKSKAPEPNDRVRMKDRRGTVIQIHKDGKAVSVLPDDRSRTRGSEVWPMAESTFMPPASSRQCPACSDDHQIYHCPERI